MDVSLRRAEGYKQAMTEAGLAVSEEDVYLIAVSVGGLRQVEDTGGRIEKDKLLVAFADILSKGCSGKEKVFRVKDDGFAVIGSHLPPLPDGIRITAVTLLIAPLPRACRTAQGDF